MPKIAFIGFPRGRVRVTLAQQDATAEAAIDLAGETEETPPPPPEPEPVPEPPMPVPDGDLPPAPKGAAVRLSVNRVTGTAPAGFFFSAAASGFGVADHFYDVRFKWRFGDPGHYTRHDTADLPWDRVYDVDGKTYICRGPDVFLADGQTLHVARAVLGPDGYQPNFGKAKRYLGPDKNIAYGPHAAHVFDKPGTYTVTCEVRRRGQAAVAQTLTVTVKDPAKEFAGADTVCLSLAGNFAGAPAGATQVSTWAAMVSAAQSGPKKRLLLRRGETITPSDNRFGRTGGWEALQYGAFGSGTPPKINNLTLRIGSNNLAGEACIWGIDWEGPYRASDPWKTRATSRGFEVLGTCATTTIWNCSIRGASKGIYAAPNVTHVVVGDVHITDWWSYGVFCEENTGYFGNCGVFIKQNPNAVLGPGENESVAPFYADNATWRCSAIQAPVSFNLVDLRTQHSWAGGYTPCLRIGRRPGSMPIEEAVMDRLRGENGLMFATGNSGPSTMPRRYVWDKCYLIRSNGGALFVIGVSGLSFRNCVLVVPNSSYTREGHMTKWVQRENGGGTDKPEISQFGLDLYSSTLVDNRASYTDLTWGEISLLTNGNGTNLRPFKHVRIGNNVVHCPNKVLALDSGDRPLDSTKLWNRTNLGQRIGSEVLTASWGYPTDIAALWKPAPGSAAIGSASTAHSNIGNGQGASIAVDDFFGRLRPLKASRGAIEPA